MTVVTPVTVTELAPISVTLAKVGSLFSAKPNFNRLPTFSELGNNAFELVIVLKPVVPFLGVIDPLPKLRAGFCITSPLNVFANPMCSLPLSGPP